MESGGQPKVGKRIRKLYDQIVFERRVLFLCTLLILVAFILWCVSCATDYWFVVDGGDGIYVPRTKRYFLSSHSGIWRICRHTYRNGTLPTPPGVSLNETDLIARYYSYFESNCTFHEMGKLKRDPSVDSYILNYNRAEAVFSVITFVLMILGLVFSMYTFKNPRYMFKRTSGALHFLSAASSFTVIEVVIHSIEYERKYITFTYPPGAKHSYGYSFVLAWFVFLCNLVAGFSFMIFSRKRKGKKAPNDEIAMADEPAIIGR